MRTRTILPVIATTALVLGACSGSLTVAEVNGEGITAEQVNALRSEAPDDVIIDGAPFRELLSLLIINVAMRTAAEDQFGVTGLNDPERLAQRIANPPNPREVTVFETIEADPQLSETFARGAAENYSIRDAVVAEIATDAGLDQGALDQLFFAWRLEVVDAAEIHVRSQVGVWGGLGDGVLPPP